MRLLILGCGDIGTRVGRALTDVGWTVAGARRAPEKLPELFTRLEIDMTQAETYSALGECQPDYVLVTPTPQSFDAIGYRSGFFQAAQHLGAQRWLKRCRSRRRRG